MRKRRVLKLIEMVICLELFPSLSSFVIFVLYMVLFIGQGLFVTASKKSDGGYSYNIFAVVLFSEITKLILSCFCYLKDNSLSSFWIGIKSNTKILILYLVPSCFYCIYNNLAFVNLSHYDPTSYFILLQLRVVLTGMFFQILFDKKLSKTQWFSLVMLTCGCIIQQLNWENIEALWFHDEGQTKKSNIFTIYLLLIVIQTLSSCFAGVYNEHLVKKDAANVNLFIQNVFMCLDSIFWNIIVLSFEGSFFTIFSSESFQSILQPLVIVIILNNSFIGITTSLFLKNLNSILKTFASAMELSFTAVLSWIIFGMEIKLNTVLAIIIISYSLHVYSKNPVSNVRKAETEKHKAEDEVRLLQEV